jgi:Na+-driven multidrug efflux pump
MSLIMLFATRILFDQLGASDYGLYNVIGGIVVAFNFVNSAMAIATQRYISFNLGRGDNESLSRIFANSMIIHFIMAILLVLLIETLGFYLITNKLQIDPERIDPAKYLLHFVVASTFITIISVPYDAVINAHENMLFLALIGILESALHLGSAIAIIYLSGDKLYYYGLFMMVSVIIVRVIKQIYSRKRYKECNADLRSHYDLPSLKNLASFGGWQLFGTLCAVARNQGVGVVLNLFYGTFINASYGIANQINSLLMFFSQTMMSAIRPQIVKSEGSNDRNRMIKIALIANKFAFYLFTFFALPLFLKMPFILKLWLGEVPDYSVEFCRAVILLTMMNQINMGLMTAVQAIGRIKVYQIVAGGIQLLTLPIGLVFLKLGYAPYSIIILSFFLESISTVFRMFYFRYLTGYPIKDYAINVFYRSFVSLLPTVLVVLLVNDLSHNPWISLIIVLFTSALVYSGFIYLLGLTKGEKAVLMELFSSILKRFNKIER